MSAIYIKQKPKYYNEKCVQSIPQLMILTNNRSSFQFVVWFIATCAKVA